MQSKRTKYIFLLLLLFISIVYVKTFYAEFISWDDTQQITKNMNVINGLSFKNTNQIFKRMVTEMYQPFTTLIYNIEYSIFGNNPMAFHIIGLLIHLLNVFLVFKLFFRFFRNAIFVIIATTIFAMHPLNVESVAWLSAQSTLLYATFYLLAMLFYSNYLNKKGIKYYWLTLFFFIISLFSKVMAVSFPVMLIAFDFYFRKKIKLKSIIEKIPFVFLAFIFSIKALSGKGDFIKNGFNNTSFSTVESIFLFPFQLKHYLLKFIYPRGLSVSYGDPKSINIIFYIIFFSLLFVFLFKLKKELKRKVIFGILLFIIPLLPTFKIKPIGHSLLFDRYVYISTIGLLFLLLLLMQKIKKRSILIVSYSILLFSIFAFSYTSFKRVAVWNNSLSVWDDALKSSLNVFPLMYYQRGLERMLVANKNGSNKNKYYNLAIIDFKTAIKNDKKNKLWRPYYQLGLCNLAIGNKIEALVNFNKSIEMVSIKNIQNTNEKKMKEELFISKQNLIKLLE